MNAPTPSRRSFVRAGLATATKERLALAKVVAYPVTDHYGVMHAKERGLALRIVREANHNGVHSEMQIAARMAGAATKEGGERG